MAPGALLVFLGLVAPALFVNAGAVAAPYLPVGAPDSVTDVVPPMRRGDLSLDGPFSTERAPFGVRLAGRNRALAYRVAAVAVMPGEVLEVVVDGGRQGYVVRIGAGRIASATASGWRWVAPEQPGAYALRVDGPNGRWVHLNVFVMVPRSALRGGQLNGYRIGRYRVTPTQPQPRGFVEASADDEDILVSPHFTLGQLLCKQPGSPRYAVISVPLILKLEAVLARVVERGHDVRTLHVMSAYRTPWYNRAIGNTTTLSRHLYGEAADVFVDADGDGYMDDLNGDGRRDVADARLLFDLVEHVERAGLPRILLGGLKAYRKNQVRGPFVHVDVRGRAARW